MFCEVIKPWQAPRKSRHPGGGSAKRAPGGAGGDLPFPAPHLPIQALSSRGSLPTPEFMSRVVELYDVREESCSLPELSDFHGAWFYQMGLRTFRGNNVAIFEDDKRSAITGQPEHHKVVEQANANDAANGIPLDPGLDPRFATHRDAQQRLDPNNSASPTPLLDDFSSGAGAGASGESASASGSASAAAH